MTVGFMFKPNLKPLLVICIFLAAILFLHTYSIPSSGRLPSLYLPVRPASYLNFEAQRSFQPIIKNHHSVAVITTSGFHKEIYGLLLWVLTRFSGLDIRFYNRPVPEIQKETTEGFEKLIAPFWNSAKDRDIENLLEDLRRDASIRYVVMTTCSWDLAYFGDELTEIWDHRRDTEKFTIGCIRHWDHDQVDKRMAGFAARDALGVLVLGEQLLDTTVGGFEEHRREDVRMTTLTPVETLVPVFPMEVRHGAFEDRADAHLNEAVIQSRWWGGSRDLNKTYEDLNKYLEADAKSWGYEKVDSVYHPIPHHHNRFILHLAGSDPAPYPQELQHVVKLHVDLPNPEFFAVLAAADVLLPAFKDNTYIDEKVSSSIGVAASVGVPILADKATERAYGYFCPASAHIRPAGVSEIDYIAMVRKGEVKWLSKEKRKAEFTKCNVVWTASNMVAMGKVLKLGEIPRWFSRY